MEEGGCEIVTLQYTNGVGDQAVTVMDGVLQTYPDLDAVLCCADDVALGASRAIEQAGRQDEGIVVCGFDGISSGVQAVIDGAISCTVAQDPYNMGYQCVVSMVDVLEGKELDGVHRHRLQRHHPGQCAGISLDRSIRWLLNAPHGKGPADDAGPFSSGALPCAAQGGIIKVSYRRRPLPCRKYMNF